MSEHLYLGVGYLGAAVGAGIAVLGASLGIGRIVAAAVEGIARQPEADAKIRSNMQLFIFLIEGLGIIGLGVAYVVALNLGLKSLPAQVANPPAAVANH